MDDGLESDRHLRPYIHEKEPNSPGYNVISESKTFCYTRRSENGNEIERKSVGKKLIEDPTGSIVVEYYNGRDNNPGIYYQISSETFKSKYSSWVKRFSYDK